MAILKCKMCGGDIELSADKTFGTCDHCGSTMTFPKVDDEQRSNMFNRGNGFRRMGEFDKALAVYERIVQEDENDAEAHWCCALCRFGIEYVEDPNTFEYYPTCHRASFDSILEDVDYLAAVEHSEGVTRRQYQKDAAKIAEVQRGILATSQNEQPFDVFICYKESENDNSRTRDSILAQEIYYQLTEQGRRVFFSRITLEDKAGTEYEPYIFAALNSAKVMIVVTTSAEHANAVWVKNEWSRFLSLMRKDRSKILLPCYRDMDPYDLPEALSVLQSYDMGKIGFIQDLIRGVNKVLDGDKPKETVKETVVIQQQAQSSTAPLLRRAFLFLEDGEWTSADEYCEKVLDTEPENGEAYLGKLMAELRVKTRETLRDQPEPFDSNNNYQKAMRFGGSDLRSLLADSTSFIERRNEEARRASIYQNALQLMQKASHREAAALFDSIADYRDAGKQKDVCLEKAELTRKENAYRTAQRAMDEGEYTQAAETFGSIADYKDAKSKSTECAEKAELARQERAYQKSLHLIEQGHYAEAVAELNAIAGYRDAAEKAEACKEKAETEQKTTIYGEAVQAARSKTIEGQQKAIALFESIYGFRDAKDRIATAKKRIVEMQSRSEREQKKAQQKEAKLLQEAAQQKQAAAKKILLIAVPAVLAVAFAVAFFTVIRPNMQYNEAVKLAANGQYEEAIAAFETLNGYKDSTAQIEMAVKDQAYAKAVALHQAGRYTEAIAAFEALNGHRDSAEQIEICKTATKDREYVKAVALYNAGKYDEAITAFKALNGYKDSAAQITKCETAIKDGKYNAALDLYNTGKYGEAITAFKALNGYKDSAAQITKCETAIKDDKYNDAISLIEKGDIINAYESLIALNGYKDSAEKAKEIFGKYKIEKQKTASIGDIVYFGAYEQDNNTSNGKEDIEWLVLAKEGNKTLVISKYALDSKPFNTSFTSVTWETCSLRKWLNGTFLSAAFSSEEQNSIISSRVTADKNPSYSTSPGYNTTDKVFLLSITEVNKYFSSDSARQCSATAYAKAQGASTSTINGNCWWWLRSPGYVSRWDSRAADVDNYGSVYDRGDHVDFDDVAVRPALWINLEKL